DVERLALRHAVDDVDEHHVAKVLETGKESERATDLAGTDQRDLVARHERPRGRKRVSGVSGNSILRLRGPGGALFFPRRTKSRKTNANPRVRARVEVAGNRRG